MWKKIVAYICIEIAFAVGWFRMPQVAAWVEQLSWPPFIALMAGLLTIPAVILWGRQIEAWAVRRLGQRRLARGTQQRESSHSPQPEEKIYTARTVAELFSPLNAMSTLQVQKHAKPHVGKWIRVQSTIRDMSENEDFLYAHLGKQKFLPLAYLAFRKEKWAGHLETMDRGDRIAAEGKIAKIDYTGIYLGDCALVEMKEDDDPF